MSLFSRKICKLLVSFLLFVFLPANISAFPHKEAKIRAAFLYQFSKYITWPDEVSGEFNICIFGVDRFGNATDWIESKTHNDRIYAVIKTQEMEDVDSCHILYLEVSEEEKIDLILERTDGKPILTVSSIDDFINKGGMVGLTPINGRINIEINLSNSIDSHLSVSVELLKIAYRVVE